MEPVSSQAGHAADPDPSSGPIAESPEPAEPCPTPLAWQQVVSEVAQHSDAWTVPYGGKIVRGRSLGEGPPLYFINGLLGDLTLFSLITWVLREDFRCVVYDLPHELSLKNPEQTGQVLLAVADSLGDDILSVYSTGFGCMAALTAMKLAQPRVRRAVIQGGFARCRLSGLERLAAAAGRWCPGSVGAFPGAVRILQENHRSWFPPFDTSRWAFAEQSLGSTPLATLAGRADLLNQFDLATFEVPPSTPTMLVRCEGDSAVQSAAQDVLQSMLPEARVESLHTCGRLPFLTHPHRLRKLLIEFCGPDAGA